MQYNIFKIRDKENLLKDMFDRNFRRIGNEIESDEYKLKLYYKYDDDLKLGWKNILIEFGEENPPTRTGISGIIICESNENNYAITYGASSFLVQKYSDREFGFDFAKRIELKEMKRKSSMIPHSTKNSSITSFKNTKTILFDSGENITSLSFTPEDSFYGKKPSISFTGGEPLIYADFILELVKKYLKKKFSVYIETNGTLTQQIRKIYKYCDVVAMDIKFKSACKQDLFKEHKLFIESCKDKVFIKTVITKQTEKEEFIKAVNLISDISKKIKLIIQPSAFDTATNKKTFEFYSLAISKISDVRILPQLHKLWKIQ